MKFRKTKLKDRRRRDAFILVERRKGWLRMYCQVGLCIALIGYFVWLLR